VARAVHKTSVTYGRVSLQFTAQRQGSTDLLTKLYADTFVIKYLDALTVPPPQ